MANGLDATAAGAWSASWHGAVVVVLVLLVRAAAGRRLSLGWRLALWGLVAVRLMMPVAPAAPASVFAAVDGWRAGGGTAARLEARDVRVTVGYRGAGETPVKASVDPGSDAGVTAAGRAAANWLPVVWLVGVIAVLARTLVGWVRLRRVIAGAEAVTDAAVLRSLAECAARLGARRPVRLACSGAVAGPAMAGVWRPVILVPPGLVGELSPRELSFVFLHELAHVKRWDAAAEWLIALLAAAHWFNPLAWVAARLYRADRELARDAMVLRATASGPSGDERIGYGATLLRLVEAMPHRRAAGLVGMVGMLWPDGRLRERVRRIAGFSAARRPGSMLLGAAAVALVGCSTLTDGKKKPPATAPADGAIVTPTVDDGPADEVITRVYDIRDLATDVPDFDSRAAAPYPAGAATTSPAPRRAASREELTAQVAGLIRSTVAAGTWRANENGAGEGVGAMRDLDGRIVVTHRRAVHREVIGLIGQLRETRGVQIMIETRFISVDKADVARLPEEVRKQIGGVGEPPPAGGAGAHLDDAQVAALTKALTSHAATTTLAAPRVVLFNGQKAYILVGTQTAYVADLKVIRDKKDATRISYEQDMQVANDGFVVDFQATASGDRERVTMTLNPRLTRLLRIETVPFEKVPPDARGERPTVQRPVMATSEIAMTVTVPSGRTVLLATNGPLPKGAAGAAGAKGADPAPAKSDQLLLMLATPRVIVQAATRP